MLPFTFLLLNWIVLHRCFAVQILWFNSRFPCDNLPHSHWQHVPLFAV